MLHAIWASDQHTLRLDKAEDIKWKLDLTWDDMTWSDRSFAPPAFASQLWISSVVKIHCQKPTIIVYTCNRSSGRGQLFGHQAWPTSECLGYVWPSSYNTYPMSLLPWYFGHAALSSLAHLGILFSNKSHELKHLNPKGVESDCAKPPSGGGALFSDGELTN